MIKNGHDEHFFDIKIDSTNNRKYQYATSGEGCKTIGWQDGNFYDFGHHLPDEMGGVWTHPIKVADGFWLGVNGSFDKASSYKTLPYGNEFLYNSNGIEYTRFQYSPDNARGVVVRYTFNSSTPTTINLDFVVNFDILPVWYSKESGIEDCEDSAEVEGGYVIAKDNGHNWFGGVGSSVNTKAIISKEQFSPHKTKSNGVSAKLSSTITIDGETSVYYYIAGSFTTKDQLLCELETLKDTSLLQVKIDRYKDIDLQTKLTTSDKEFDNIFKWVKFNTDWLISDCGEYGRALSAGAPEYLWWFGCDNSYSIQGLLAMGEFTLAKQTLKLLHDYSVSHNNNGRIVHEITSNGKISNPGNSQETAHYITAVYNYLRWTGDIDTVRELYDYCEKGIHWLLDIMDKDNDLLPSGYGIIEIQGLSAELIDTAVYTCKALYDMADMAKLFSKDSKWYLTTANKLKEIINTRLWDDEQGTFIDAVGTPSEIIRSIEILQHDERYTGTITPVYNRYLENLKDRMKTLPQDEDTPVVINKNWVILIPMETLIATKEHTDRALDVMDSDEYIGEYGTYLAGFMHANTMTISTGVHAVALGRNGRTDSALALLKRMCKTFSLVMPNSITEMSPDYGCFTQAWTVYSMLVPVVECFAGINPQLISNTIVIKPAVPKEWNSMELKNIRVGEATIDFSYKNGVYDVKVSSDCPYTVKLVTDKEIIINKGR